ncbi:hypothetical protein M8C21_016827, partial [Ambrosia artemisiifolia]
FITQLSSSLSISKDQLGLDANFSWCPAPAQYAELLELQELSAAVWVWEADQSGCFSVRSIRDLAQRKFCDDRHTDFVPIKVNFLMRRLIQDRLPTAAALCHRNIIIPNSRYKTLVTYLILNEFVFPWENVVYIHLNISDMYMFAIVNETYVNVITQEKCCFGVLFRCTVVVPLLQVGIGNAYEALVVNDQKCTPSRDNTPIHLNFPTGPPQVKR